MKDIESWRLPGIYFDIDGEQVEAVNAMWEMSWPCGCACGWSLIMDDCITEDQAWLAMSTDDKREVKRRHDEGYTLRRIKSDNARLREDCSHRPKAVSA